MRPRDGSNISPTNEIPAKWEYLVSIFSQESILKGSFDKYADSQKGQERDGDR